MSNKSVILEYLKITTIKRKKIVMENINSIEQFKNSLKDVTLEVSEKFQDMYVMAFNIASAEFEKMLSFPVFTIQK